MGQLQTATQTHIVLLVFYEKEATETNDMTLHEHSTNKPLALDMFEHVIQSVKN